MALAARIIAVRARPVKDYNLGGASGLGSLNSRWQSMGSGFSLYVAEGVSTSPRLAQRHVAGDHSQQAAIVATEQKGAIEVDVVGHARLAP